MWTHILDLFNFNSIQILYFYPAPVMRENCFQNCLPFEGKKRVNNMFCFVFFASVGLISEILFSFWQHFMHFYWRKLREQLEAGNQRSHLRWAQQWRCEPPEICGNTFDFVFKLGLAYLEDFYEKVIYFLASRLI